MIFFSSPLEHGITYLLGVLLSPHQTRRSFQCLNFLLQPSLFLFFIINFFLVSAGDYYCDYHSTGGSNSRGSRSSSRLVRFDTFHLYLWLSFLSLCSVVQESREKLTVNRMRNRKRDRTRRTATMN